MKHDIVEVESTGDGFEVLRFYGFKTLCFSEGILTPWVEHMLEVPNPTHRRSFDRIAYWCSVLGEFGASVWLEPENAPPPRDWDIIEVMDSINAAVSVLEDEVHPWNETRDNWSESGWSASEMFDAASISIIRFTRKCNNYRQRAPLSDPPCHELALEALRVLIRFRRGVTAYRPVKSIPRPGGVRVFYRSSDPFIESYRAYFTEIAPSVFPEYEKAVRLFRHFLIFRSDSRHHSEGEERDEIRSRTQAALRRLEDVCDGAIEAVIAHEVARTPATRQEMAFWINRVARKTIIEKGGV